MEVYVGTSGYQYDFWRGGLYPEGLKKEGMLASYAQHFRTVEVNNTFYRMPKREVVQRWADATPDDFRFVIKASKRITHKDPLTDADSVAYLFKANSGRCCSSSLRTCARVWIACAGFWSFFPKGRGRCSSFATSAGSATRRTTCFARVAPR